MGSKLKECDLALVTVTVPTHLLQEREVHFALVFSLARFSAAAMREDVLVGVSFPQC